MARSNDARNSRRLLAVLVVLVLLVIGVATWGKGESRSPGAGDKGACEAMGVADYTDETYDAAVAEWDRLVATSDPVIRQYSSYSKWAEALRKPMSATTVTSPPASAILAMPNLSAGLRRAVEKERDAVFAADMGGAFLWFGAVAAICKELGVTIQ